MRQFNYKCTVAKNGTKMYYRKVGGKWKRISNAVGKNAEKGKKKYSSAPDEDYDSDINALFWDKEGGKPDDDDMDFEIENVDGEE